MEEVRGRSRISTYGIVDAGRGVYFLDDLALPAPKRSRAPVSGHHRAADVANPLALGLELEARGGEGPLVETELFRRDVAQVALDDEEGQARTPPWAGDGSPPGCSGQPRKAGQCSGQERVVACGVAGERHEAQLHSSPAPGRLRKNEVSEDRLETLGDREGIRVGGVNENHREILFDHSDHIGRPQNLDELPGPRSRMMVRAAGGQASRTRKSDRKSWYLVARWTSQASIRRKSAVPKTTGTSRCCSAMTDRVRFVGPSHDGAAYPMAVRKATHRIRSAVLTAVAAGTLLLVSPAAAGTLEIGPDTDLCGALQQVEPGAEIVLQPGDYRAGCVVRRGGLPQSPVVIRAADPERPPRLSHPGLVNMLEIRTSDIVIRGLAFGPTAADADGVRVIRGDRITIEDCQFTQLGGIAVAANHTSARGLTVRRNVITNSNATALYFGCHDGISCSVTGLVVVGNRITGVTAPNPEIGYGIEVKLNSSAVIRDNIIVDTKGPGIMVYGSRDLTTVSVVERNFVRGSRTSSGIVSEAVRGRTQKRVRVERRSRGGLENYGRRGLLLGVAVTHNTVYANGQGGIMATHSGTAGCGASNNAGAAAPAPASSRRTPGPSPDGQSQCAWLQCFADPEGLDFSPGQDRCFRD